MTTTNNARNAQDNNIANYSLSELNAMLGKLVSAPEDHSLWTPFNLDELKREIDSRKPQFKKEWTPQDFKTVEAAIRRHLLCKELDTHKGKAIAYTLPQLEDILGLAYTSSSAYAMYGICNVNLRHPNFKGYRYFCFALSTDGKVYAELWDKDENELYIPL